MNEKIKLIASKEDFENELNNTLKILSNNYPRISRTNKNQNLTTDLFTIVIYNILTNTLNKLQVDCNNLSINEFHAKYTPNLPILYRDDFTTSEAISIVNAAFLKERDKKIAHKFFVEKKNITDIYIELPEIDDKKTINNNLESINRSLLLTACKYNSTYKNKD